MGTAMANMGAMGSDGWLGYMVTITWQVALVWAAVWLVTRVTFRRSAALSHALWLIVLLRLLLPTDLSSPVGAGTLADGLLRSVTVAAPSSAASPSPAERSTRAPAAAPAINIIDDAGSAEYSALPPSRETSAEPATTDASDAYPISVYLFAVWMTGVLFLSAFTVVQCIRMSRLVRQAHRVTDPALVALLERCQSRLGVPRFFRCTLLITGHVEGPLVTGLFRPCIVVPEQLIGDGNHETLEPLLLHELAHVKRLDLFTNWLQVALLVLHWFNPVVWLTHRALCRERERACDDQVLASTDFGAKTYVRSLVLSMEAAARRTPALLLGALGVGEPWQSLRTRVTRILDTNRHVAPRLTLGGLLALLCLAAVVLPLAPHTRAAIVEASGDINSKVALLDLDGATRKDVIRVFGEPEEYVWGQEEFHKDNLPEVYCMVYPDRFMVVMHEDRIGELRFHGPGYRYRDLIEVGTPLEEALQVLPPPTRTVRGESNRGQPGVFYQDVDGKDSLCHYKPQGENVRLFFFKGLVSAIYVTSDVAREQAHTRRQPVEVAKVRPFDDVRDKVLSSLDLRTPADLLQRLTFNQATVWPDADRMPSGPTPGDLMASARNPGLGVRDLHREGVTGQAVNVAIIDQPLLPDHPEYAGKIAAYFDTGCGGATSSMHGPAVMSLLVGNACGTAPGARVYYAAAPSWKRDAAYYAKALDWILEQNAALPNGSKIRVVSVSAAPSGPGSPFEKNGAMWDEARSRAEEEGVLVLDCTEHRGLIGPCWLDMDAPESPAHCTPGFPKTPGRMHGGPAGRILAPTCPRTTAECYERGRYGHIYWAQGGLSWAIPYASGVLALGWQVRPQLNARQMVDLLFETAYTGPEGHRFIDPKAFVGRVKSVSSDWGPSSPEGEPEPPQPARKLDLNALIPRVDIGSMDRRQVTQILGEPVREVERLLEYADGLSVFMSGDTVREIRFSRTGGSGYLYRGKLDVGSSLDDVFSVVGEPSRVVVGRNEWEDGVLYKDIDGTPGYCYYQRADQGVRFFFTDDKIFALYLTDNRHVENRLEQTPGRGRVRGRVVGDVSGQPIEYAAVACVNESGRVRSEAFHQKSDYDYVLPPGEYTLYYASTLSPAGIPVLRGPVEQLREGNMVFSRSFDLETGEDLQLDLALPEPFTLSLRLVDNHGDPVVGAAVGPWYRRTNGSPFRYGGHRTDAEGRFTLYGFMPGVESGFNTDTVRGYTQLDDPAVFDAGIVGESGKVYPEITVVLDRLEGRVAGTLVDSEGNPLANQSSFVEAEYDDGKRATQLCRSNSDGEFSCAVGRPDHAFKLVLRNNGGKLGYRHEFENLTVSPEETIHLGRLVRPVGR